LGIATGPDGSTRDEAEVGSGLIRAETFQLKNYYREREGERGRVRDTGGERDGDRGTEREGERGTESGGESRRFWNP
jgi:hypothetical protein